MSDYRAGEYVDITIKGARIVEPKPGLDHILTVAYQQTQPGVFATLDLTRPKAGSVTIERVAPAEWPPKPGDVWRDRGGDLWFVYQRNISGAEPRRELRIIPAADTSHTGAWWPDRLLADRGPLTLVHREDGAS